MKIRRKKRRSVPVLNMASMPDLIFTVLFFFMIVTHMRNEEVKVKVEVPQGTEVSKLTKKHIAINIYIGKAKDGQTHIQVNDKICDLSQVGAIVKHLQSKMPLDEQENMTVNLKADRHTDMGIINDVKKELRKAGALTIKYSALEMKNEES